MAKKNVKTKTTKNGSKKKNHIKSKTRAPSENKIKETVRVKTFIVEKPVYVEAPSRFQRMRQRLPRYLSEESRYSKRREEDFEEEFDEQVQKKESVKSNKEYIEDDYSDSQAGEPLDEPLGGDADFQEGGEFDEPLDETGEAQPATGGHLRSRGLFNNVWWKKGLLKGFSIWLVIAIIFYLFDFLGLAQVVDAKRWLFFLVLLLILGMGYQKYLSGKVSI